MISAEYLRTWLGDESTKVILTPDGTADDARNKDVWRLEYMTLQMRDREKFAEGMQQERMDAIQRMVRKGYSKDDILDLDYTEEEYAEALKEP